MNLNQSISIKKKINILQNIKWHLKYGGLHIKL